MINIDNIRHIHFVGIGGIGVSSVARYFILRGFIVSGSDLVKSQITEDMEELGAKVFIGSHRKGFLPKSAELVVHTPAVHSDNQEIKAAKSRKVTIMSYPEVLGHLTRQYISIAVSGSHGKSTTTALISLLLEKSGFDPTVIIGTKLREFGNSNCRVGNGRYLVLEADEWSGSFLNYWPKIIVLTNIEREHMDYFKDMNDVFSKFKRYIGHLLVTKGILVANLDSKNVVKLARSFMKIGGNTVFYSSGMLGKYGFPRRSHLKQVLKIPGEHNVSNACGALMTASILGISDYPIHSAWGSFYGAWRRFEILNPKLYSKSKKPVFISDYAHHPTEIKATIAAAREKFGSRKRIICIYQPHQFQRTHYLFKEFVSAFDGVNELFLLDIYDVAGRENKYIKANVSSEKLVYSIKKRIKNSKKSSILLHSVRYLESMERALKLIKMPEFSKNSVVLIMGAGSIIDLANQVKKFLGSRK